MFMPDNTHGKMDQTKATLIGHICIRDPDSEEVILSKRDLNVKPGKDCDEQHD